MNRAAVIHRMYREHRQQRFRWGRSDCLGFAIACAEALGCGGGLAQRRAGHAYGSGAEAAAALAAHGWRGLDDLAASLWERIPPALAQTGDWALVVNPDGTETLGVVMRDGVVAQTLDGLALSPRSAARTAYRVA